MRGMKGDTEIFTGLFSVLIFVAFIAGLVLLIQAYFVNFSGVLVSAEKDLLAVDASHLVENCLKDEAEFIDREYLDRLVEEGKTDVCKIESCKLCGIGIGVKIKDLETGKEWNFKYDESSRNKHFIYTNIKDGENIHVGRIYVSI
ncbi:MAG: hypothetical protein DRP54_03990 [Spirochaetes bacterium]|nr:MAG: hypothetical protein DRP54_03990 [Spirochaetota bacterium]